MPNKTDQIVAALEELLKRRGTQKPTDRLGLERPVMSRDFDNQPMASWEKAAALIGAAVSPVSTIASTVLAPPPEESLFDRAITGPDGKTYYPEVAESVVPRMKKARRKSITPNPVVTALQRAAQKGPFKDPANDVTHQKINDRDFLVHATRPSDSKKIMQSGAIMPGSRSDTLPENILKDPLVLQGIKNGSLTLRRSYFSGRMVLGLADGREYELSPKMRSGIPGVDESVSPGVSLSRQMVVPELSPSKSYRFLLDPRARKTFATAEPGFGKAHRMEEDKVSFDPFESEQRTFGAPYPISVGNRAITDRQPAGPTEEYVRPGEEKLYRATMGNERFRHIRERVGEVFGGDNYRKYAAIKNQIDDVEKKISSIFDKYKNNDIMYDALRGEWSALREQHSKLTKELESISLPDYLKY